MDASHRFADDKPREECGIFGIHGHAESAAHTALGLHALQHRGQEAAGIVSHDGEHFHSHRSLGLVGDSFGSETVIKRLKGGAAIGHVRYSTTGGTVLRNVQPLFAEVAFGGLAIAHNGNLTNALTVRERLVQRGCLFQSTTDTEVIIHLVAISNFTPVVERMVDALLQVEGAYSLVALTDDALIGVRDPLYQRLILPPHEELEVTQVIDTIDPAHRSYNPKAARAKTVAKGAPSRWGEKAQGCERAHDEDEMSCFACHSSWVTSCAGCHQARDIARTDGQRL